MRRDIPVYDIGSISELRQGDILVSRFAPYSKSHTHLHYPHRHSFFHILLFTEGKGSHAIDFQTFPVKPGQIYFMVPGQVHSWSFEGHVDGYVINFSPSFFQAFLLRPDFLERFPFFSGSVSEAVLEIPDDQTTPIVSLFEEILEESGQSAPFSHDLTRVLLLKIFILVSRLRLGKSPEADSSYNYTLLRSFQQLIERHYAEYRLPKEYAGLLYITPNHLNALCNDLLGISAGELIRNRITLEAKRLLINLDLSVTEVSWQLNFRDNSYFTKFFKKHVGITPEEFRKKALRRE